MNAARLYKLASILLLLFGVGHTSGLYRHQDFGPEGNQVFDAMHAVHIQVMGRTHTFWDFYLGFGLLVSVLFFFTGVWAWQLGALCDRQREAVKALAWPFFLCQAVVAVLCCTNFFLVPIVFGIAIASVSGLAAYRVRAA
jgi:hypothetical protein